MLEKEADENYEKNQKKKEALLKLAYDKAELLFESLRFKKLRVPIFKISDFLLALDDDN